MTQKPTHKEREQAESIPAEDKQRVSELWMRSIFNSLKEGVLVVSPDRKLKNVNEAAERMFGYSKGELANQSTEVLHLDHKHYVEFGRLIKEAFDRNEVANFEFKGRRKNGEVFPTEHTVSLLKNDSGETIGIVSVVRDISERKRAEEALRESEEKYRSIFENINDVYYKADLEGELIMISPSGAKLLGYDSVEEMIGKNIARDFYADPKEREHLVKEIMEKGKIRFRGFLKRKDGTVIVTETISHLVLDEARNPIAVEGIFRDVTEQDRVEKALMESEAKARALLNSPTDSLILIDIEGIVLDLNETAAQRLNKSIDEIIGTIIYDIFPSEVVKHRKAKAKKVVDSGKPINFTDERDDKVFENTIFPVFDTHGNVVELSVYGKDITELKKTIQALEKREKELELKTKSLEQLNTAMKVLLEKRKEDKTNLEDSVMTNVNELIIPYFDKIKATKLDEQQKAFLSIIESNMNEIISPFTRELSLKYLKLTPTEIKIANMVKHGITTKEIAKILNISPRTVDAHRKNIRTKIGLKKKRANLRSHLLAMY